MNIYNTSQKYFNFFIKSNFDLNNEKIIHKVKHTYQVVNNAKYICEDMHLSDEDKDLAMVIALLHDIGRFEQAKEINTFREDITNYDHATLGVKFLFEQNEIRNFIKTDKYDIVIKTAIANHNKYILDELDMKDIENSKITDKIYNDFMTEQTILSKDRKTGIDIWISYIAFIFGLEFKSSLKLIKEKDYVNKLFNRFSYKIDQKKMNILRDKANCYLEDKLKK